jgi:hypothetical protein
MFRTGSVWKRPTFSTLPHEDIAMAIRSALLTSLAIGVTLWGLGGCQYYEDYRVKKATADLKEEHAQLLHAYRLCLEKYQDDPPKAKEFCAPYTQRLRELEITHQSGR